MVMNKQQERSDIQTTLAVEQTRILKQSSYYNQDQIVEIEKRYQDQLKTFHHKIFVLDDDPTGVQTVHGVSVYTDWHRDSIVAGFDDPNRLVYILTNSRAFQKKETAEVHQLIAQRIAETASEVKRPYLIISRSDSTLRGHYPLETEVLRKTIEENESYLIDGELIVPFFPEGGRYTINNIHYVKDGNQLIPAGESEFARDLTFSYQASHLGEWCEEKSAGAFKAADMIYLSLEDIRQQRYEKLIGLLMQTNHFNKIIINAVEYTDLKIVTIALLEAIKQGKKYLFRTAAALPKILGGIPDRPLLSRTDLMAAEEKKGGFILIGSHVKKTSDQLAALRASKGPFTFITFNQHRVLEKDGLADEARRVREKAEAAIREGQTAVVFTRRERFELPDDDKEAQLRVSVEISDALSSIVANLQERPSFLITKGGITSSDVGTKALRVKRATVMGQVKPGIPVWMTGHESKFSNLPLIIFPGNVGDIDTLKDIAEMMTAR